MLQPAYPGIAQPAHKCRTISLYFCIRKRQIMKERFKMNEVQPEAYTVMAGFENYMKTTKIGPLHKEMIKIRASQINGCAYCVNQHTRDARKLGETEQRINLICVWREAPQFTEE